MLTVKLDPDLSGEVASRAKREKKTKTAIVREAVVAYLEEATDAVEISKRKRQRSIPLKELGRRLGLES